MRITRSIFIVSTIFFHFVGNYLYFKKNLMRNYVQVDAAALCFDKAQAFFFLKNLIV